jgi:hypothetical protein
MLINFRQEDIVLRKATVIGRDEEILPCVLAEINDSEDPEISPCLMSRNKGHRQRNIDADSK